MDPIAARTTSAGFDPVNLLLNTATESFCAAAVGLGKLPAGGIRGEKRFRLFLGLRNVWLVERIDRQHRTGDRRGKFPAKELRAEIVDPGGETE